MRFVLDINVFVSALLNPHGSPGHLYAAWKEQKFSLITSLQQISYISEVLKRPKLISRYPADELAALEMRLNASGELVEPRTDITASSDPEDNSILGIAIAGQADYLVTGDKPHLLNLHEVEGVKIVTVRAAIDLLERSADSAGVE